MPQTEASKHAQTAELSDMYTALSPGKKRLLLQRYTDTMGSRATFFRKVKGEMLLLKREAIFFINHL